MVYGIIKEIESSLKNENFIAALALALTLPDICGYIVGNKIGM